MVVDDDVGLNVLGCRADILWTTCISFLLVEVSLNDVHRNHRFIRDGHLDFHTALRSVSWLQNFFLNLSFSNK